MVETNNRVSSRIEASLHELRSRLEMGVTESERAYRLEESAEAVGEQGLDLLDRIGWFDQVHQIVALPEASLRFQVVAELFLQNGEALEQEAAAGGLEEEYQVTDALIRFLSDADL